MRQLKIKNILEKHLKIKINKNINIKLNSLKNYDSLTLVQIVMAIENIDRKKIPLNKLNKIFKISDLLKL
jgi:acyl carrier protein